MTRIAISIQKKPFSMNFSDNGKLLISMNKNIKITTNTSRICIYDLYALKHRLNDNSNWISSEGLAEMNKGI